MNTLYDKQSKYEKALKYEIFTKGEYNFAIKELQNAKCIFDIGGHKGFFSQRCRTLNSNSEIHYFEPIKDFYNEANRILRNEKNIIFNNYGISVESGKGTIILNQEKTMQSSKYLSFLNPKGTEINVDFITIKKYLQQNQIDKIDVLKMDIEGMEFEVLSSWGNYERKRINNLIVEIHLLNDIMKNERKEILTKIKNIFRNTTIIKSKYCNDIFLLRAKK